MMIFHSLFQSHVQFYLPNFFWFRFSNIWFQVDMSDHMLTSTHVFVKSQFDSHRSFFLVFPRFVYEFWKGD